MSPGSRELDHRQRHRRRHRRGTFTHHYTPLHNAPAVELQPLLQRLGYPISCYNSKKEEEEKYSLSHFAKTKSHAPRFPCHRSVASELRFSTVTKRNFDGRDHQPQTPPLLVPASASVVGTDVESKGAIMPACRLGGRRRQQRKSLQKANRRGRLSTLSRILV
ncbi:hypothetical protein LZ32DRAFT_134388 [Colletotrichum eremochloae]|nr:hypothetical protein LZ32DRAFT_134388 [Colletotrichum eremochloae]